MVEATKQMQLSMQEKDEVINESLQEQSKLKEALNLIKQTLNVVEKTDKKNLISIDQTSDNILSTYDKSIMSENFA